MTSKYFIKGKVKRSWNRILVVTLSLLVAAILVFSWFWVQKSTALLLENNKQFLQVYTENLQTTMFSPIEIAASKVQTLLQFYEMESKSFDLVSELYLLRATTSGLDKVWIVLDEGQAIYAPNVNKDIVEQNCWWKTYMIDDNPSAWNVVDSGRLKTLGFALAEPFRDELDLSTILPVAFWYRTEVGKIAYAFLEFNLTSLLIQQMNNYHVKFGEDSTPVEVILYDQNGMALESSRNIPLQVQPMLKTFEDTEVLESLDLSNGMVFAREDSYISIFSRNTTLGLTFTTRIPLKVIVGQSQKNYLFIFLLAGLFSVVFLILMIVYVRLNANIRRYEALQAESRFEALQARMNPHFLFNTLDSLVSVVEVGDRQRSLDTLRSLSYMLHFDLREQRHEIPLLMEVKYIRNYVNLQEIRYKGLFSFELEIHDSVPDDIRILKYCIQPLVENCFVHGVYLRQMPVSIKVVMTCDLQGLHVLVADDGPGCSAEQRKLLLEQLAHSPQWMRQESLHLRGKHIGLLNIHQRILYAYGQGFGLSMCPSDKGFCVEVLLPYVYQHETNQQDSKLG